MAASDPVPGFRIENLVSMGARAGDIMLGVIFQSTFVTDLLVGFSTNDGNGSGRTVNAHTVNGGIAQIIINPLTGVGQTATIDRFVLLGSQEGGLLTASDGLMKGPLIITESMTLSIFGLTDPEDHIHDIWIVTGSSFG